MAKIEIETYTHSCGASLFYINGMDADTDDFGEMVDCNPEEAPEYGCGNRMFVIKNATQSVLDKYVITLKEYDEIARELKEKLSIGMCCMCE